MDLNNKEFKVFGKGIEKLSAYYGVFLILWGVLISFFSKSSSMTSYIPSYLGAIIFLFAVLSLNYPNKKKIYMHIVALIGVITMLGGLDLIRGLFNESLFVNFWADLSKIMMLFTGSYFVYLCIMSFRFARKAAKEIS